MFGQHMSQHANLPVMIGPAVRYATVQVFKQTCRHSASQPGVVQTSRPPGQQPLIDTSYTGYTAIRLYRPKQNLPVPDMGKPGRQTQNHQNHPERDHDARTHKPFQIHTANKDQKQGANPQPAGDPG